MGRYDSSQKRAVLEAAIAVFAEKGLEGATIRLIGRKAGVNSALIYYYFENKRNLFEEAIRMVMGDFLLMFEKHKKAFATAGERIAFLVNGIFDYYETRPGRMRLMIMVFNLYTQLLIDIILELVRDKEIPPLSILQDGIIRKQLKPFAPIQLWWNILGMCIFTLKAQQIAAQLAGKRIPWSLPSFNERKKQIIELLLSGAAYYNRPLSGKKQEREL